MYQRVRFLSRPAAEAAPASADAVVVSLIDPGTPPPQLGTAWCDVLQLAFFDADDDLVDAAVGQGLRVCEADDARRILAFLDQWHERLDGPGDVIVHCEQGISRSAAVAKFCARRYGVDFPWDYPFANRRVLRLLHEAAGMAFDAEAEARLLHEALARDDGHGA